MDQLVTLFSGFLISTLFIALGSTIFHLSALISGYSIYRDLPQHQSTLITGIVGALLFILSPLSYFLFFPPLIEPGSSSLNPAIIQRPWDDSALLPFALIASGLGIGLRELSYSQREEIVYALVKTEGRAWFPVPLLQVLLGPHWRAEAKARQVG